ncbi:response regulator [Terriglobus sp.]|uniref:response regulator n=1 Tax=Terriglobus sp. TaxID=1889013 RepID=UPI003AFF9EAF
MEDNTSVRNLIRRMVADISEDTIEREDGSAVLEAYREHRPDVVLMDVKMPCMDGLSATRQLLNHFPKARVVIVTDYDDDHVRFAARDAGAVAYALKQNLTDLEAVIQAAFTG